MISEHISQVEGAAAASNGDWHDVCVVGISAKSTKILVYADSAVFSGAESLLCEVVSGLAADPRFEVAFVAPESSTDLVDALRAATGNDPEASVPAQPLPLAALHLYDPRRRKSIAATLSGIDADVMLLNLPSAEYGATPLLETGALAFPVVGLMHISRTMAELGFRLGSIRTVLTRHAVRNLESVCVVCAESGRHYASNWSSPDVKITVVRLPAPVIRPGDQLLGRRDLGLPEQGTLIGMAGRLTVRQKGQDIFVDAAAQLIRDRPDLKFVLAGEGKDRARIEKMIADRGLEQKFLLLGQVENMSAFLDAIDLIVIPSRFEGLPLIALEALAAGVPGVTASVDGLCDVWPPQWRVEPEQPGQLARSLGALLDAGESAQADLVQSGRKQMKDLSSSDPSVDVADALERALQ